MILKKLMLIIFIIPYFAFGQIIDYQQELASTQLNGQQLLLLRSFKKNETLYYLAVDIHSMNTSILLGKGLKITPTNWTNLNAAYLKSPYLNALTEAKKKDLSIQDAGIAHGYPQEKGITLTIDLCPSHKPLDRGLFTNLIAELKDIENPVPLGLSLSGKFLMNHADDMDWLLDLQKQKKLDITWINHSLNHFYQPGLPLEENFLLKPGTLIENEVLGNEKIMLEHGIIPSVFFRFPGLVSDQNIVEKIINYGLIPIGSDAWLAKGQQAAKGSIVLIHGNGNEPLGIADFIKLLHSNQSAIRQKQWLLFDLRTTISEGESH